MDECAIWTLTCVPSDIHGYMKRWVIGNVGGYPLLLRIVNCLKCISQCALNGIWFFFRWWEICRIQKLWSSGLGGNSYSPCTFVNQQSPKGVNQGRPSVTLYSVFHILCFWPSSPGSWALKLNLEALSSPRALCCKLLSTWYLEETFYLEVLLYL